MDPIITLKKVNFTYNPGKTNEYQALINIDLEVYPEEFIIFFGPSGCGKSTLLNILAGLEVPDNGSVFVFGRDLTKMSRNDFAMYHRDNVGMIYQQYNLITSLTVLDNVALPQIFINIRKGKRNKWARNLLDRFGILDHADKIPTELSGGQQQRIGIARSIVNNPQMVLADEPVGNLDSVSAENVLEILDNLNKKEKKTIVMVTHNPEHIHYGDRIIYMKDGIITREVINRDKYKKKLKKEATEENPIAQISNMMRSYRGLSPEQINILIMPYKAKIFAHHFITSRTLEETRVFEEIIQRRMLGTISEDEVYDILKRSSREGGVGFNKQTAGKILRRVNRVVRMAFFVYQKGRQKKDEAGKHEKITIEEKAQKITDYLLMTCYHEYFQHLDKIQIDRLRGAVMNRLNSDIQKMESFSKLDTPFNDGGVGLNSKTAKAITEEMELILILGFGMVQSDNKFSGNTEFSDIKQNAEKNKEEKKEDEGLNNKDIQGGLQILNKFFPHSESGLSDKEKPEISSKDLEKKETNETHEEKHKSMEDIMQALQEREDEMKNK